MAVKTYHDTTLTLDLTGTVLKQQNQSGDDRQCPECKGWVRVSHTNYLGNPQVMEAITHARPCEAYRTWLKTNGCSDYSINLRN